METLNVKEFVEMFNEIKEAEKGRKGTVRGLSEKDERNFKKLVKRGFTREEFRAAAVRMFRDPEQWAVTTGNDIPSHLLRSENFERYLNAAINIPEEKEKEVEEEKPEEKKIDKEKEAEEIAERFLIEARNLYSKSLKAGKWLGSPFHANVIARDLAGFIDQTVKSKLWKEINTENENSQRFNKSIVIGKILEQRVKYVNPVREFSDRVVREAVKLKILEPWLQSKM